MYVCIHTYIHNSLAVMFNKSELDVLKVSPYEMHEHKKPTMNNQLKYHNN